jgi:hypothetical protein
MAMNLGYMKRYLFGEVPTCISCRYYDKANCQKYYDIDLVNGNRKVEAALYSRKPGGKCGLHGKGYEFKDGDHGWL